MRNSSYVAAGMAVLLAGLSLAASGCSKPEEPAANAPGDTTKLAVPEKKNERGATVDPVTGKEDAALTAPAPPPGPPGG